MVDLLPLEIAQQCAINICSELKSPYSKITAVPAIKQVLGFEPNARLTRLNKCKTKVKIDSRDCNSKLKTYRAKKQFNGSSLRLEIKPAQCFAEYQQQMLKQWQYGYQKAIAAYQ